jgi:hypothetical protein
MADNLFGTNFLVCFVPAKYHRNPTYALAFLYSRASGNNTLDEKGKLHNVFMLSVSPGARHQKSKVDEENNEFSPPPP